LADENKDKHIYLIVKTNTLETKFEKLAEKSLDTDEENLSQSSGFYPCKNRKDGEDSSKITHDVNDFLDLDQHFSEFVNFEKRMKCEDLDCDNSSIKTLNSFSSNCQSDFFDNISL